MEHGQWLNPIFPQHTHNRTKQCHDSNESKQFLCEQMNDDEDNWYKKQSKQTSSIKLVGQTMR